MEQLTLFPPDEIQTRPRYFFNRTPQEQRDVIEELRTRIEYKTDLFYNLYEVAGILGITYYQAFYLIKFYRLDAVKIHSSLRVPAESLIEYIQDRPRIIDIERSYYQWIGSRERRQTVPA